MLSPLVTQMKDGALKLIPNWWNEELNSDLVLSDDIDGLVSTSILKKCKGWNVEYFYDFEHLYITDKARNKTIEQRQKDRCWCDISILLDERCFDNHVNRRDVDDWENPLAINPNKIAHVTNKSYTGKYAGSTALLLWSLYKLPLPETEEGKMLLLSIDSAFKGFYYERFSDIWRANKYFISNLLDFPELYELMKRHTLDEFYNIVVKYNVEEDSREAKKTRWNNGKLETNLDLKTISDLLGIDISLPDDEFSELLELNTVNGYFGNMRIKDLPENYMSAAYTYKGKISASYIRKIKEVNENGK